MLQVYTLVFKIRLNYNKRNMPKQTSKKSTTMPKRLHERVFESDGIYFLKLVVVFLLGTFWIKFAHPMPIGNFIITAIPVGVFVGFLLVRGFEKHQADRKIWYALLVVIGAISAVNAAGIVI
jgi:predicted membrane chloride channel (bestrophin family)